MARSSWFQIAAAAIGAATAGSAGAQDAFSLRGSMSAPAAPTRDVGQGGVGAKATWPGGDTASLDTKGITLSSGDGDVKFRIGGRLQADFGTARARDVRLAGTYDDRLDLRRTWLELYLTLRDSIEFAFQYDFANRRQPINDAVVAYRGLAPFIVSFGNFKEPFSLGQLTSDNDTLFAERSLADAFAPARNVGLALGAHGDAWTAAAGVFGGNANTGIGDDGVAGTGRLTYAPILREGEVLHLGLSGSYRALDRNGRSPSFESRPESFLFRTSLVSTGSIPGADAVGRIGVEAAYQTGPVRLQGEYIWTGIERSSGQPDASLHGGYIEAGWTLNGKGRPYGLAPKYGSTYGIFGAPELEDAQRVLRGGIGLFELGARVSYVDLTDRDIAGGREVNYTLGLNWYPESNVKVAANYVRATAYDTPAASRRVDADIFIGRLQIAW